MRKLGIFAILLLAAALVGCAVSNWARIDETSRQFEIEECSVTLPTGWMLFKTESGVVLSKDGPDLQTIGIWFSPHAQAFKTIEKQTSPTSLPSELAELAIAEIKASSQGGIPSLKIVKNSPVEIAGRQGFELHMTYKNNKGLRKEIAVKGFVSEKGFYYMQYRAPTLHYFERDRPVFETVADSFSLKS